MAHAQSSVTLYGVLDAAVLCTNKSLNTRTGANDGHKFAMVDGAAAASRFGLRGVEDLGGGMKATFVLERHRHPERRVGQFKRQPVRPSGVDRVER